MACLLFGLMYFLLILLFEYKLAKSVIYRLFPTKKDRFIEKEEIDSDVEEENSFILNTSGYELTKNHVVVIKDMTKYFHICLRKFCPVNGLCLAIKSGECFGLLGVKGAGKTSTFKMLTGDENISYGHAWINRFNLKTHERHMIGYCPQLDAVPEEMQVDKLLKIYCLIHGVPINEIKESIARIAKNLGFEEHLKKKVRVLSGGTKQSQHGYRASG